jgi:hypothetical protein
VIAGLSPEWIAAILAATFVAGVVDAIAGGGGLISVPVLMLAGLNPVAAIATNKLQAVFGVGTACWRYARAGLVDVRRQGLPAAVAFAAAVAGASLVASIPTGALKIALPALIIAVALFFALRRDLTDDPRPVRLRPVALALTAVPLVGFYDGLVGPGAGSFYMLAFVMLAGQGLLSATAHTKFVNLASNLGSLLFFLWHGAAVVPLGLLMVVAQIAGANVGAHLAMRNGARIIRPLVVVTSTALAARLIWAAL